MRTVIQVPRRGKLGNLRAYVRIASPEQKRTVSFSPYEPTKVNKENEPTGSKVPWESDRGMRQTPERRKHPLLRGWKIKKSRASYISFDPRDAQSVCRIPPSSPVTRQRHGQHQQMCLPSASLRETSRKRTSGRKTLGLHLDKRTPPQPRKN